MDLSEPEDGDANEDIYCICRRPYDPSKAMVQCDDCMDWLHYSCIGIKDNGQKEVFSDDFDCPICARMEQQQKDIDRIRQFVQNARNVDELQLILTKMPLDKMKEFVLKQIDDGRFDSSNPFKRTCINKTLPDDIIQSIISFDSNRKNTFKVCKKWHKISKKVKSIRLRKKYQMIRQQLKNDTKEDCLLSEIRALNGKKRSLLNDVLRQYEADEKKIKEHYSAKIIELRNLSAYQCHGCGGKGSDKYFVKCKTCAKELCLGCMLACGHDDCGSEEYYCSAVCSEDAGGCEECGKLLCQYCEQSNPCEFCDKKVCENCIVSFQRYEEWGSNPWEDDMTTHSVCTECHEREEYG